MLWAARACGTALPVTHPAVLFNLLKRVLALSSIGVGREELCGHRVKEFLEVEARRHDRRGPRLSAKHASARAWCDVEAGRGSEGDDRSACFTNEWHMWRQLLTSSTNTSLKHSGPCMLRIDQPEGGLPSTEKLGQFLRTVGTALTSLKLAHCRQISDV